MQAQKQQRIVRALVQEIDSTLQQYYRQSLKEVVQDLTMHNAFRSARPTDAQILTTLYETGVLRMSGYAKPATLHSVLERFAHGTIGICSRCARGIEVHHLEKNITARLCTRCQSHVKVPS